jgi:hypothetical protein
MEEGGGRILSPVNSNTTSQSKNGNIDIADWWAFYAKGRKSLARLKFIQVVTKFSFCCRFMGHVERTFFLGDVLSASFKLIDLLRGGDELGKQDWYFLLFSRFSFWPSCLLVWLIFKKNLIQFPTTDLSALASMKNAANCDT